MALVLLGTNRYTGLVVVGAYIALLNRVRRAVWRHVDREERQLLDELDAEAAASS
ncbi:MAG: hypothetical protein JO191_01465 [Mycobacteriaceae bacterium]|nr:hypothetical protein [Mycobacteriaceae bacterium]